MQSQLRDGGLASEILSHRSHTQSIGSVGERDGAHVGRGTGGTRGEDQEQSLKQVIRAVITLADPPSGSCAASAWSARHTADNNATCTARTTLDPTLRHEYSRPAGVTSSYDVAWRYPKSRHRLGGLKM
jgi:hypothetical protein